VEECLRHNGSVAAWRRLATRDVVIGGMRSGRQQAADRHLVGQPRRAHFADADLFDIHRDNASDQLTFGYGSHQCMGKNLARMEMQIFLEEFTRRLPHAAGRAALHLRAQHLVPRPRASVGRMGPGATPSAHPTVLAARSRCASANRRATPARARWSWR
jgi:cytochrome P450